MAYKSFNDDVRSARIRVENAYIDGVIALEHGESDGEVVFNFMHKELNKPITIHLVSANLTGYPDENNFLLNSTSSDDKTNSIVTATLEDLQNYTFGQTILETLCDVANGINRALSKQVNNLDQACDMLMDGAADDAYDTDDADDVDAASDSGSAFHDHIFDDDTPEDSLVDEGEQKPKTGDAFKMAPGMLNKVKRDLRKVCEAGAKIGIFAGVHEDARSHLLSLSIRARKLGISDEALEAWDVNPSDYIILLLHLPEPYPSAKGLLECAASSIDAHFLIGKCKRSKPSDESVRSAFCSAGVGVKGTRSGTDDRPFEKLFLSSSLEEFMNAYFFAMFKLRLTGVPSWDAANSQVQDLHAFGREPPDILATNSFTAAPGKKEEETESGKEAATCSLPEAHDHQTLPTILTCDFFADSRTDISMPLVALQFALHYLVRCTEYCLRCHRKVDKEFEALKPFVCQNPLCLFQYITMGFGPSVEHEILTQPYVVDLLVTLCYSSVSRVPRGPRVPRPSLRPLPGPQLDYGIDRFPTGLHLKVPSLEVPNLPAMSPLFPQLPLHTQGTQEPTPIKVVLNLAGKSFSIKDHLDARRLKANSWVVLRHWSNGDKDEARILHAYIQKFDALAQSGVFELKCQDSFEAHPLSGSSKITSGTYEMELFNYDSDFDDLDDDRKASSMRMVLDTLPPIFRIREWLIRQPHSKFRFNDDISPSAASLLEWIIASNRSLILQVSSVQDRFATDKDLLNTIKTREQEIIPSMRNEYVQFRFAVGSPDKELRFRRALKELETQRGASPAQVKSPTLFAWHGSALQNWHSILRQGLNYSKIDNGRAFGHGVYFSARYETSRSYMQLGPGILMSWANSALLPDGVIALCEIINAPEKFAHTDPHLVVPQIDWIQCRYLFVRSVFYGRIAGGGLQPGGGGPHASTTISLADTYPQAPAHQVLGPNDDVLQIPRKALPGSPSIATRATDPVKSLPKRAYESNGCGDDTDEEDAEDLDALISDDQSTPPPPKRFQALANLGDSRASSVDTGAALQLTAQRPPTPPKLSVGPPETDFKPGTLDLKSIPQLALPDWANSAASKQLVNDIKTMQKVQATTPLHELGWYIDFDKIENMFQWIVELHTFDPDLPLAQDMKKCGITSIVLELRFGKDYPLSPPFVRVIRPRFLPFMQGGGGHITIGGAICMEMLTNTGWLPTLSPEAVLLSVKMAMSSLEPQPARLLQPSPISVKDYSPFEAFQAFQRFAGRHGWQVPQDVMASATQRYTA
ncbi:unnamed protein product [Discula destructiva]